MYWQQYPLRDAIAFTRGSTYKVDLPESGLLSSLFLKLTADCTSGASLANVNWRLQDLLTTVEIIGNGSTIIKSATFKNLQYCNWLRQGIVPPHNWRNYATNTQMEYLWILFGRKQKDRDYGLDLSRWDNVELRITNSSSATFHSTELALSILMTLKREDPAGFKGYLRTELWREWATVADEWKYHTLPTEYPISGIYLRAMPHATLGMSDTGFGHLMEDILLSKQGGALQIFNGHMSVLMEDNLVDKGAEVITSGLADLTADRGVDVGVGRMYGWSGISGSKDGAVSAVVPTMIADATDNTISFEAREADSPVEFIARGMGFQNTAYLLHNQELDPDLMIDPKKDGECLLNIHTQNAAAAAAGVNQITLERLVQ